MRFVLNLLWLVLSGFWMFLAYMVAGVLWCITIIGIPFGLASFRIGFFALWPFGRTVVKKSGAGVGSAIGNVFWFILSGVWLAHRARPHRRPPVHHRHRDPARTGELQADTDLSLPTRQGHRVHPGWRLGRRQRDGGRTSGLARLGATGGDQSRPSEALGGNTSTRSSPGAAVTLRRRSCTQDDVTADHAPEPRDASEVGFSVARAAWAEAARPVLLEAAGRYRATVTYKQLASAVQESTGITTKQLMHQWIGDVLGRVTDECQSRGEPLLSALCVSAQGSVGQGYAEAVEHARGTRPDDPDDHAARERLGCYQHWQADGLPPDGGTPLRTAHFALARKPRASKPASRASTPRKASARKSAAAVEPKPAQLCPRCFTQVPASGVCDYCE